MPEHVYDKQTLIRRLDACRGLRLYQIDNDGVFDDVQQFNLQKGIVGTVVERCIFRYPPDSKQEADLVIVDGEESLRTELKTTGMVIESEPQEHFVAKEPMSITAVGIYSIAEQSFQTSHFWNKIEHMLIIYYHYSSSHAVTPYEYRNFVLKGYDFHEFSEEEVAVLRHDWECVRDLCADIASRISGPHNDKWRTAVKQAYINNRGQLRRVLSYIDLAPKYPPRFRLKKSVVSVMISKVFQFELEQLPGHYSTITDIDRKCGELTRVYGGRTVGELIAHFGLKCPNSKAIAERIIISMFGGQSSKLNQIELFRRFGLIAKSIVITPEGGRTEDMKLFHVDFSEISRKFVIDSESGLQREIGFEDSEFYEYFADNEFLCIVFEESSPESVICEDGRTKKKVIFSNNRFIGFKRLVFSDDFIDDSVRKLWVDTREKVIQRTLQDVVRRRKDGSIVVNQTGSQSSSLNLLKSKDNDVFIRGSATDTSPKYKTERVNGLCVVPQYVWITGKSVIEELSKVPWIQGDMMS